MCSYEEANRADAGNQQGRWARNKSDRRQNTKSDWCDLLARRGAARAHCADQTMGDGAPVGGRGAGGEDEALVGGTVLAWVWRRSPLSVLSIFGK